MFTQRINNMKSFTDISQNCLSSEKKLSDIKKIFKKIKKKIVFIVKSKKLIGTITDGDIRKIHFSSNANSISVLKVMNQNPSFVYQGYEKKDLNKMFMIGFRKRISITCD